MDLFDTSPETRALMAELLFERFGPVPYRERFKRAEDPKVIAARRRVLVGSDRPFSEG